MLRLRPKLQLKDDECACFLPPSCCRMTAEVEEQISHLRAQHLRSEQEKDLYRIKLEEEKLEREKAQKQVRWVLPRLCDAPCVKLAQYTCPCSQPTRVVWAYQCVLRSVPGQPQARSKNEIHCLPCVVDPQVEVARKMMFESGSSREDVPKKSNRRETWCPGGKAGWKAPASAGALLARVACACVCVFVHSWTQPTSGRSSFG
eukprot:1157512-Pelagomonas_calceolata.AAC.5